MYFHSRADALRGAPAVTAAEGRAGRGGGGPVNEVAEELLLVLGVLVLAELVQECIYVGDRHLSLVRRRSGIEGPG